MDTNVHRSTARLNLRLTRDEHDRIVAVARASHLSPSSWARQVLLEAAEEQAGPEPEIHPGQTKLTEALEPAGGMATARPPSSPPAASSGKHSFSPDFK